MAQPFTVTTLSECDDPEKFSNYEIQWTIRGWRKVRKSEWRVNAQKIVFETGSPSFRFKTKWLVGLQVDHNDDYYVYLYGTEKVGIFWELLEIKGSASSKVEAKLQTQLLISSTRSPKYTHEISQEVELYDIVEETSVSLQFKPDSSVGHVDRDVISNRGNVRFTLKLSLKTPPMSHLEYGCYKMDQFSKTSKEQLRQDQVALLNDTSGNADLRFFTSDGVEIPGHRTILTARCPVFAAMLNCDLSENTTGIIQMTDITAKTMKILMRYFYTGELLQFWQDPDTIVEFTYAAGKYQMSQVLELLDDMLGRKSVWNVNHLDVLLISFAGKLKLEKAEARLLKIIVERIKNIGISEGIFELFGFDEEELSEMADVKIGGSRILKTLDQLWYGADDYSQVSLENGMVLLAKVRKEKLVKLEIHLLKCLRERATLVKNGDELFALFGRGLQVGK